MQRSESMNGRIVVQAHKRSSSLVASGILSRKMCNCGRSTIAGGECAECREKRLSLQRRAVNQARPVTAPPIVHEVLGSPGRPLDPTTRICMESRFNHDFDRVRIHTNQRAATSAQDVNALAYTVGRDVVFGAGQYTPATTRGKRLIAHELTHVMQQGEGTGEARSSLLIQPSGGPEEREANAVALSVASDNSLQNDAVQIGRPEKLSPIVQRAPTFNADCNEYDRCRVVEPLGAANQMVDRAISELPAVADGTATSGRIFDLVNVHFHDPSNTASRARFVLGKFRAIKGELNSTINFDCHPPEADCTTDDGQVGALTGCSTGSEISLCPAYYRRACGEQARMIIHEMAHHVSGLCTDHAYVHDSHYMTLPPNKASGNPDTYAQFAKMVFLGTPSCKECSTEIQLRPGQY